jgi:phage shock protein A
MNKEIKTMIREMREKNKVLRKELAAVRGENGELRKELAAMRAEMRGREEKRQTNDRGKVGTKRNEGGEE